ncbi:uncharacterized protein LOC141527596 [Cotesia typhae]|uniref:uncharacterized protein LOC141527596 n=1 Tax=Cotesia typhae TaxID=2053667 RepID=UPI003D691BED
MYHLPAITKDLQLLFNKFPSWTNAMVRYYKSENYVATSSRSENYFRFIKDNVLTDRQTNRADLFIAEHTKSINTKMIEAKSYYNNEKLTRKKPDLKKDKKKMDSRVLNFVENWKNRVIIDNFSEVDLTENEQSENDSKSCYCDDTKEDTNFIQDVIIKDDIINSTSNPILKISNTSQNLNKNSDCTNITVDHLNSPQFHSTPTTKVNISNNTPSNLSIKKNAESSYTIILDEKLVDFQIKKKELNKRQINSPPILEQVKKRGKYLTACPEVQELHQNAADKEPNKKKKKKQFSIIKNSCFSEIGKRKVIIVNTCPIDSLSEVLSFAYLNFSHFRNFVNSKNIMSNYFSSVVCYARNGATSEYYQKRLTILRILYPENNYRIDCNDNISDLFEKLMKSYESIIEKKNFFFCKFEDTKQMSILNISAQPVWNHGFDLLEEMIEYRPPTPPTKIGHYVAYTRSINNKWTQLNDLEPYPIKLTSKLIAIRISLLFYALA